MRRRRKALRPIRNARMARAVSWTQLSNLLASMRLSTRASSRFPPLLLSCPRFSRSVPMAMCQRCQRCQREPTPGLMLSHVQASKLALLVRTLAFASTI